MILTAPDISSVTTWMSVWEYGEYFFSFAVALACFGEYVADFKPQWYRTGDATRDEKRKEEISKKSTLLLIAALVFELVCVVKSNALAGEVIGSIDDLANNAAGQANAALSDAQSAHNLAQNASDTAEPAKVAADEAKGEAKEVEQKVGSVGKKATAIDQKLDMVQFFSSSRRILHPDKLRSNLEKFKGMSVTFRSYMNDGDGYLLCKSIVPIARDAGILITDQCGTWPATFPFATGISVVGPDEKTMVALMGVFSNQTAFPSFGTIWPGSQAPSWLVFVGTRTQVWVGETPQTKAAEAHAKIKPKRTSAN